MRRPQFSLKWLLIGLTLCSIAFYLFFIRPTMLATQFVRTLQSGDHERLAVDHDFISKYVGLAYVSMQDWDCKEIALEPRTWDDIWHFRRRIKVDALVRAKNSEPGKADQVYTAHVILVYATYPYGIKRDAIQRISWRITDKKVTVTLPPLP